MKKNFFWRKTAGGAVFALGLLAGVHQADAQGYLDNETLYSNQDPNTETRRSDHFRVCFGHFNRDTGTPMTEQLAQGNLQMFEQFWNRWVNEMGLHDLNESSNPAYQDGHKYRANFHFLMTWDDGGGGGAFTSADPHGFFYAMGNTSYDRYDPPSGAIPHEFGHVWEGAAAGFNGSDSSGSWWECTANWMMLQFENSYPQPGGYLANSMYYPAHGRDYYDSYMIWEAARDDARYGPAWVNNVWTNANASQQVNEYILDRMIRCDSSGSADKAGGVKDLWGDMAKKMVTLDFERQRWLAAANSADDGTDWGFYQRCRTPLVKMPGTNGWYRVPRQHAPMEFGFNIIPLTAPAGTTISCNFQPQCDPVRQSDWRACLVAVNTAGQASYSTLWNMGTQTMTLSPDQNRLYLVVIAVPEPMKIVAPVWNAYLTDAGLQFPYAVAFSNAAPRNVTYPAASHATMHQHPNGLGWVANSATVDATAYVGPNAQVLTSAQVRNYARIEDYAVVRDNAQVRDNAIVSGHAIVQGNAKVYGQAKVRDWANVFGYAEIFENARVIEHANCGDGNATTHTKVYGSAVIKGTTYVYDTSTLNGCLIMDGDSANGNGTTPASHGVHFGWGWGQDVARFNSLPDNGYVYAQHTFEKDNAVFAMDQFGINHGLLMNGCRAEQDSTPPARGGRVLPLNGTNQYVELHNSVNDFKDSTFAVWAKPAGGAAGQYVWSMGDGTNKVMSLTLQDAQTGGVRFAISDGVTTQTLDGGVVPVNAWTHVAVVFSGSTCTLYVNGTAMDSNASMTLFPDSLNAPLMENANYLGRGNAGGFFQGSLDDFRVYMKALSAGEVATLYSTPAPDPIVVAADSTAPTPNAATWLVPPTAVSDNTVTMSATPGTDASGWVEYYFSCTAGPGHDSGWVSFNKYTDVGIVPGAPVTYSVRMRDRNGNTTSASTPATATANISPLPSAGFSYGPVGIANGQITMMAAKATNTTSRYEFKFDRTSPTTASSGWQSSPQWTDTGLTTGASFTYTVTVRDGWGNVSAPSAAVSAVARDDAPPQLPISVAHWEMLPYATIDNRVSMTATAPTDAAGIQYQFHCVSGGGPDSSWQSSRTFLTPVLPDGTYVYEYRVRDTSPQLNTSGYSTTYAAKITPTTGYHGCTLAQALTNPDDYLVSFPATVLKVNTNNYYVKDLASGLSIKVRPSTSNQLTDASLALKNVLVNGHLYTFGGVREVTFATLTATGDPTLYPISGKVTNSAGAAVAGATVYFADAPDASAHAIVTTTTDSNGNYSKGVTPGTWYVAVGASSYNTTEDRQVMVAGAGVPDVNFGVVANAVVRGMVTRRSDGLPVPGATVYFARVPGASSSPLFTTLTAGDGTYAQAVQDGVWYVSAGGAGYYTAPDLTVTVAGEDVGGINFALKSSARNVPQTAQLLFSAVTDALPAGGAAGNWPSYLPSGQFLTALNSPQVEVLGGVKWEKNVADGPGFRLGYFTSPIPVNGATIVLAARPKRTPSNNWDSLVDIFYDRLVLGIRNDTGQVNVRRNGSLDFSSATIPEGQATVLSLVVQPNGQYKVWANGVPLYTNSTLSAMTALTNGVAGGYANGINVGRNDPDGWTTFNGNIGDVFVYKSALIDADRQTLEADLMAKFLANDPQITASANAGGTLNPSGSILVPSGGSQSFTITPAAGNTVSNVVVDGVPVGSVTSYTFTGVTTNHTLSVAFASAPVSPPTLSIAPNGTGGLDITWSDAYSGTLLTSPVLGAGATWVPVAGAPQHLGNVYKFTITPNATNAFYGLSE